MVEANHSVQQVVLQARLAQATIQLVSFEVVSAIPRSLQPSDDAAHGGLSSKWTRRTAMATLR